MLALPLRSLSTTELQTLYFCPGHWTPNTNVPMGRFLLDATNATNPNNVLNKGDSFIVAENLYGVLKLPSIQTIVTGWVKYIDEHDYRWSEMRIYKEDIRGAFSQVKINPDHATLLAVLMSSNMLMIHLFGVFGWHAMPLVFAVFSRALLWVMAKKVAGVIDIYVDDFMGLSHRLTAQADQYIVQSVCRATFGLDALADDNLVASSVADILGYRIDLIAATIRPSDKGIRKLAFVFFTVSLEEKTWPLRTCQVVASLSERYSSVLVGLRPFVDCFNKLTGKFSRVTPISPNSPRKLSSLARCAVVVWRAVILLLDEYPAMLAVPIRSLSLNVKDLPEYGLLSDAATGLGLKVWAPQGVIMFAKYSFKYDSFQGNTQNVREFLGD